MNKLDTLTAELNAVSQGEQAASEESDCIEVCLAAASFAQERMWFLHEMWQATATYNVPAVLRIEGELDISLLEKCFVSIIQRHETLRTSFALEDDQIVQIIHTEFDFSLPVYELPGLSLQERRDLARQRATEIARRPFDLARPSLLRVELVRIASDEHLLVLTMHHIISDEWSFSVLFSELSALLEAYRGGSPARLEELPIQYADYAAWQRTEFNGHVLDAQLEYWKSQFPRQPTVLDLPIDRPRPGIPSGKGRLFAVRIPKSTTDELNRYASRRRASLFMAILAAYNVLLHRFSGQSEIVVGTPIANRNRREIEGLIGLFLNTLPLKIELDGSLTFDELLGMVRDTTLGAFANQDIPFERLVEELRPDRNSGYSPIFQTLFTLQNEPFVAPSLPRTRITLLETDVGVSRFDLSVYLKQADEGLVGEFEYSTDLFDESSIARMAASFLHLLQAIPHSSHLPIARLPIFSHQDLQQLLLAGNPPRAEYRFEPVHELFRAQAVLRPNEPAVEYGQKVLSYRELDEQSDRIASLLVGLGINSNALVGISLERSADMVAWQMGILKTGGAYLPIDPSFPLERRRYMLEDAHVQLLITHSELLSEISETVDQSGLRALCVDKQDLRKQELATCVPPRVEADHLAYVIYTSGSTGKPKGVQIPHRALTNFLLSMKTEPGIVADDTLLAITTLSFDISVLELFLPLIVGARVVVAARDEAADGFRLAQLLEQCDATMMQATPATWQLLLESGWSGKPDLKILCGGEALSRDLANELAIRGQSVWNLYGPTETTVWSAVGRISPDMEEIPLGYPIANTELILLSEVQQAVPIGVTGNLYIGGDGLALGYLNRAELTAEKFIPHPFREGERLYDTGDLARRLPDGSLQFLGRRDHQVKIRGFRIELGEIEHALNQHGGISQSVVVARALGTAASGGSLLVAYLLAEREPPSAAELREHLRQSLPEYMIPSHFIFLTEYPLTPNRKVDRRALPAPELDSPPTAKPNQRFARDALEQQLVAIWRPILGVKSLGLDDNFFDLGGHSLAAARMMTEIESQLGHRLPLAMLLQAPTVAELADKIRQQGWELHWDSLVPIRTGGGGAPLFCIHAAGGNVLLYRELAEYLAHARPIFGLQSAALGNAVPAAQTVPAIAAEYIQEIRKVQPSGPYHICGYCLGGSIAYEVAQQLRRAGAEIGVLALFDTHSRWHQASRLAHIYLTLQQIWFHAANVVLSGPRGLRSFLKEKASEARRRGARRLGVAYSQIAYRLGFSHKAPIQLLEKIYDHVTEDYIPEPYAGKLTVFKPRKAYLGYEDPYLGWRELAADIEVIELPVFPAGMLLEPFVRELAKQLDDRLVPWEQ